VRGIPRNASAAADRVDDNILNIIVRRREERKGRRSVRAGRRSVAPSRGDRASSISMMIVKIDAKEKMPTNHRLFQGNLTT
jgi:hypothetical protein